MMYVNKLYKNNSYILSSNYFCITIVTTEPAQDGPTLFDEVLNCFPGTADQVHSHGAEAQAEERSVAFCCPATKVIPAPAPQWNQRPMPPGQNPHTLGSPRFYCPGSSRVDAPLPYMGKVLPLELALQHSHIPLLPVP